MALACDGSELALQSCEPCKYRKKKCDRSLPTCTTCKKKLLSCIYEDRHFELRNLRAQVAHYVKQLKGNSIRTLLPTPGLLHIDTSLHYPIPAQWYMPFLLQHYRNLIGPTVSPVEHGENGSFLADSWIQASFSNPCMFHAVLLAASSHLDVIRKELNNPITDYHRRNTVQLLVNNISSSEKIPYTSMAATMYLWQYDSMHCYTDEAEVHKNGLLEMVKSAGGLDKLGFDGFLARLITLVARANGSVASRVDIGHSILNGSRPVFADLARLSLPLSPLTLLSARLSRPGCILSDHYLPSSVWDLVRHVHEKTLKFECQILKDEPENVTAIIPQEGNLKYMPSTIPEDEPLSFGKLEGDDHFHAACRCAANIHLKSLGQLVPFSSNGNQKLVRQLEFSLSSLSNGMWLETETEIYIWLCFTGVAAAQAGKAWFLAKVAPTVLSLKPEEFGQVISRILRFWRLILYLKGLDV